MWLYNFNQEFIWSNIVDMFGQFLNILQIVPPRLKIFTTLTNSIKRIYFAVTSFHGRITSRDCRAPDRRNSSKFLIFFSLHFPRNRNWNVSFHTWFILLLAIFVFHCTSVCSLSEITDIIVFWSGSCSLRVFQSL